MKKTIFKDYSRKSHLLTTLTSRGRIIRVGTSIMLILATLALSCDRPELHTSVTTSDSVLSACQSDDKSDGDALTYQYIGGVLHITHELMLNCASSAVAIEASISGNVITINYTVDDNISADCLCPKTLNYSIQNLPSGNYTLIILLDGYGLLQQNITV